MADLRRVSSGNGSARCPRFSPDGTRLAFLADRPGPLAAARAHRAGQAGLVVNAAGTRRLAAQGTIHRGQDVAGVELRGQVERVLAIGPIPGQRGR